MSRHYRLIPALALALAGPAAAQAQSAELMMAEADLALLYGDEESVSVATGLSKPLRLAPAVASVITADEIRASGARTLAEALERVPGVHAYPSALDRMTTGFSIRGIRTSENAQVLVLIDGVPLVDLFNGHRGPTFRLPVESIARIEVVRGPGSAVYGADAFAGVISVITKSADDIPGNEVGVRAGAFDSRDVWADLGGAVGGWDVAASLELSRSDGDDDRRIGQDAATGTGVSLAPGPLDTRYDILTGHVKAEHGHWTANLWGWRQQDGGVGAGGAQALDPAGRQDLTQYTAGIGYADARWAPDWEFSFDLDYLYQDLDAHFVLLPPGVTVPIGADGNIGTAPDPACTGPGGLCLVTFPDGFIGEPGGTWRQRFAETAWVYTGLEQHRWRMALGYKHQELEPREEKNFGPGVIDGLTSPVDGTLTDVTGTPYIFARESDREVFFASLQDEWQMAPDWELTAGARYDDYSDVGGTFNPRAALVWATRHDLTTKLLYGRAFRAPSFSETSAINNPVLIGNAEIDPETIDTVELVLDYRPALDWRLMLSLFRYEIDGLIEFVPNGDGTSTARNATDQEGRGFEMEAAWEATADLAVSGNFSYQRAEDADTGEPVADAPARQAYLAVDWRLAPRWRLYGQAYWIGERERAPGDPREPVDDYTWVTTRLAWEPSASGWSTALSVKNLLDEDAREPAGTAIPGDLPREGRSVFLEAAYRF